ncbi:MAG: DUF2917 domain-containing protein [Ideonella sp.]|nr:DUF2917 domain-containing protein [Ideonella sp.]MCC7459647.1 DUF2917 domain-containing protein [Nitrospira sp.]
MDDSLGQALIRLRKGAVHRLPGQRGDGVAVFEGEVWITEDGSRTDTILEAGQSQAFGSDGNLVVQAFADAVLIRFRGVEPAAAVAVAPQPRDATLAAEADDDTVHRHAR